MNSSLEENIPAIFLIIGFLTLLLINHTITKLLGRRSRTRQGQQIPNGKSPLSIEKRISSNRGWASGEIRSKGPGLIVGVVLVALVWNLTFGLSFVKTFSDPNISNGSQVVLGVFALMGLVPIGFAIMLTLRHLHFGRSYCRIQGKAGLLGKTMNGTIRTSRKIQATGDYTILLESLEIYTTGSGKERKTAEYIHWQGKQTLPHLGAAPQLGIPFSFDLPSDIPETGSKTSRGQITWYLRIKAPVEGIDYSTMFIVPVFHE